MKGKTIVNLRIFTQTIFLLLFIILFSLSLAEVFFWFDPLFLAAGIFTEGEFIKLFLLAVIPLSLTFFLGRFFCGWICPFGTINQFFTWLFHKSIKKKTGPQWKLYKIKYLVLAGAGISVIFGFHFWGWLDPFSFLTRSLAVFFTPAAHLINLVSNNDSGQTLYSAYPFLIGGLFIFMISMNYFYRRFFCNVLCPLGALYGLASRFGFLRFSVSDTCTTCKVCSKNCTYYGDPFDNFEKSECLTCFNCMSDCPSSSVQLSWGKPKRTENMDIGKRKLIGATITGLAAVSLSKASPERDNKSRHNYLRPPGSISEKDFIEKCARCGQCVKSCPTGFIQPAFLQAGLEGIWTPILDSETGHCLYDCNLCTNVCPTNAIEQLALNEKKIFKIGTAVIDRNLCYTYADGFNCTACADKCPTEEKAIKFRELNVPNFMGKTAPVRQIYIDPDLCTGCGICVTACPRDGMPGIYLTADDEQRESVTGII